MGSAPEELAGVGASLLSCVDRRPRRDREWKPIQTRALKSSSRRLPLLLWTPLLDRAESNVALHKAAAAAVARRAFPL